ncbi:hypothetical protein A6R68_15169, partial [Neotoma lepida]
AVYGFKKREQESRYHERHTFLTSQGAVRNVPGYGADREVRWRLRLMHEEFQGSNGAQPVANTEPGPAENGVNEGPTENGSSSSDLWVSMIDCRPSASFVKRLFEETPALAMADEKPKEGVKTENNDHTNLKTIVTYCLSSVSNILSSHTQRASKG